MFELLLSRRRLREQMLTPSFTDLRVHTQVRDYFAFSLNVCSPLTSESASSSYNSPRVSVSLGE